MQRQGFSLVYLPTGAIYMADFEWFLNHRSFCSDSTKGYIISIERSSDIDSELDFKLFETIIK